MKTLTILSLLLGQPTTYADLNPTDGCLEGAEAIELAYAGKRKFSAAEKRIVNDFVGECHASALSYRIVNGRVWWLK